MRIGGIACRDDGDAAVWEDRPAREEVLVDDVLAVDLEALVVEGGLEQHVQALVVGPVGRRRLEFLSNMRQVDVASCFPRSRRRQPPVPF